MHGTRPAPEAHESQRLRGATPPRHRTRREVPAASAGAQWSIRRRGRGSSAGRDANNKLAKSGLPRLRGMPLPCQREHADITRKKLEKRGAILPLCTFARFYATDGRNACSARPYQSSTFVFA